MRRIGQSDKASIHTHTSTHTSTAYVRTIVPGVSSYACYVFPYGNTERYRCPQPKFENRRIRPALSEISGIEPRHSTCIYIQPNM